MDVGVGEPSPGVVTVDVVVSGVDSVPIRWVGVDIDVVDGDVVVERGVIPGFVVVGGAIVLEGDASGAREAGAVSLRDPSEGGDGTVGVTVLIVVLVLDVEGSVAAVVGLVAAVVVSVVATVGVAPIVVEAGVAVVELVAAVVELVDAVVEPASTVGALGVALVEVVMSGDSTLLVPGGVIVLRGAGVGSVPAGSGDGSVVIGSTAIPALTGYPGAI